LDPTESISGYTQHELADLWGQQTGSTPVAVNPSVLDDSTDPRGRRGSMERYEAFQKGLPNGVSFIGGVLTAIKVLPPEIHRTIVGQPSTTYFAPFVNILADNTVFDFNLDDIDPFIGGYPLTPQHQADLDKQGVDYRDPSDWLHMIDETAEATPTLLDLVKFIATNFMEGQFVKIVIADKTSEFTPKNIEDYRQETENLSYKKLLRSTGEFYSPDDKYVADPDLVKNLDDSDPSNDFPRLSEINRSGKKEVIPFVQAGYYFAFQLDSGAHTVNFGDTSFGQDITYDILNPVYGTRRSETLVGTCDNDYLEGGKGNDKLLGRAGDDLLVGGRGADILKGGAGSDELWGDAGRDIFVFRQGYGSDAIYDFEVGDKIDIRSLPIKSIDEITDEVTLTSGVSGLKLDFGNGDILTLVGIEEKSSLSISNGFITTSQNSSLV
jgi:RTX calcium-binding nonapeptide repeat (4 copies)